MAEVAADIAATVAKFSPEQLYDFVGEMKACVDNNAAEAEAMLMQNPALNYTLLEALILMGLVDSVSVAERLMVTPAIPLPADDEKALKPVVQMEIDLVERPQKVTEPVTARSDAKAGRISDPRLFNVRRLRKPLPTPQTPPPEARPSAAATQEEVESRRSRDPRLASRGRQPPPPPAAAPVPKVETPAQPEANTADVEDERTALIMQVLQLTEEQIDMLPPEQREGVLQLREQIRLQNAAV
ncbi:unnamed protein product [Notodromas monacha]|uniref:Cleavage stimulation factor subunit 2 hinge domain-containing protein n=1 Tax=Notodromas monacha TaxID=399045 RepID=A0A7R9BPJ2_9CRUS|nr:unnamed protein product [Notodromas monacha]CAG0919320.1 unnamed protein product [Notodromas monacha]